MTTLISPTKHSGFTSIELQEKLDRIREQIFVCVAEAKHYVKHVELLNEKVTKLAIEEEKIVILLEKSKSLKFCQQN